MKAGEVPICLMMIDIDHFKKYNDDNGHLAEDACLKAVAEAIRISIRPSDLLGRHGGEEFVIFLPNTSMRAYEISASRVKDEVEKTQIKGTNFEILPSMTISIGVSGGEPGSFYDDLFKSADAEFYKAKESGRNCICYE